MGALPVAGHGQGCVMSVQNLNETRPTASSPCADGRMMVTM
jgi:hypothetical protein